MFFIFVSTFAAYWPALSGGFIWDDDAHVTRAELRSVEGLGRIWLELGATQQYYPLLHSAFWVEHKVFGDDPTGYHVVNVVLHGCVALLMFGVLRRLGFADWAAFAGAGVFALHPVNVESVAWITEQKNTLSGVFYLSAMLVYLRFDESRKTRWYWLAIGLFVLGLMTKTVIATLPAALLVIFWWRRGRLEWKRDVKPLVAWFVVGAGAGLFTAWVEHELIGAKGEAFELSFVERILLSGRVVWFYLWKLAWPVDLTFIYPRWEVDGGAAWQWIFPAGLGAVLVVLGVMARRWRGPLAVMLIFIGTLFPVLGFFNVFPFLFSFVADHFAYLASMGVISGVVGLAMRGARGRAARGAVGVGLCALIVVLGVLTWRQSRMYSDAVTLYQTTLERNPGCWMAHNNLGSIFNRGGDDEVAIVHFRRALELRADYPEAHCNIGLSLANLGDLQEAEAHYRVALQLREANPEVHGNYGAMLMKSGRVEEAVAHFDMGVRYMPDSAEMRRNLAMGLSKARRYEEAVNQFRLADELKADSPQTHFHWGAALAAMGRFGEAIVHYEAALRLKEDYAEAHYNYGVALAATGKAGEAVEHYEEALRIRPDYLEAMNNLAVMYAQGGRTEDAFGLFARAVAVEPESPQVLMNFAIACDLAGRRAEAMEAAGKALEAVRAMGDVGLAERIEAWMEERGTKGQRDEGTQ